MKTYSLKVLYKNAQKGATLSEPTAGDQWEERGKVHHAVSPEQIIHTCIPDYRQARVGAYLKYTE